MALVKTKGLIVKETPFNDTDKMLTLLTQDYGKISVSAKNARRSGSKAAYGTQVLTYGEYVLFRAKNSFSLNSCDILMHFYDLSGDLTCFTHAAHILEMAGDVSDDPAAAGQVLSLVLHGLQALKKGRNPLLVSSAFSLKLMQIAGYPPHITSCVSCGDRDMETLYFSYKLGGFVCEKCKISDLDCKKVDIGTAKALLHVLCAENSGIFNFELSNQVLNNFSDLALRYISERLDKSYRKLEFLKEL